MKEKFYNGDKLNGQELKNAFTLIKENLTQTELENINKVKNMDNILNHEHDLHVEKEYQGRTSKFKSEIEKIEEKLASSFLQKITLMRNDIFLKKEINAFINDCRSAWRVPYKFISKHKKIIRLLFNCFISTPESLADVIDWKRRYSYVLFDEASQLRLEKALPFIAQADRCIISGDDQQMQPSSFFSQYQEGTEDRYESAESLLRFRIKRIHA